VAIGLHFKNEWAQWHAKQCKMLGICLSGFPIELNAIRTPGAQQRPTNALARFGKETTGGLNTILWVCLPIIAQLRDPFDTKAAQQDIVWPFVLGMQFKPMALEVLNLDRLALNDLLLLHVDRHTEDSQPTILLPELADAATDTESSFSKAALGGLGVGTVWHKGDCGTQKEQQYRAKHMHHERISML